HIRYPPAPLHAGPSAHSIPVCNRVIGELPTLYFLNAGSSTITSGSGYRIGGASGPNSRANKGAAARVPRAVRKERRVEAVESFMGSECGFARWRETCQRHAQVPQ